MCHVVLYTSIRQHGAKKNLILKLKKSPTLMLYDQNLKTAWTGYN
jgi:hypothetical protein